MPFSGSHYPRHAGMGPWCERILGILSLIFVLAELTNIVIRNW
jgi:hypothetical protein